MEAEPRGDGIESPMRRMVKAARASGLSEKAAERAVTYIIASVPLRLVTPSSESEREATER